jgi:hypothetical protein
MLISRKLARKVHSHHTVIIDLIRDGKSEAAITAIHALTKLIERYIESPEDEQARAQREEP